MVGYIYKTTNLVTGKFYIGKRQKSTFDKYYYGSGKHLASSVAKYGKENFYRETLEWCESIEELDSREKYWIEHLDARNPEIGYNISEGGEGNTENGKLNALYCFVHNKNGYIRILKTDLSEFLKAGYLRGRGPGTNGLTGAKKSADTRKKISESNKGKHNHSGEHNPCFGSSFMWVTDGISNRRLPLGDDIPIGWKAGKTQKKPKPTEKSIAYINKLKTGEHWRGDKNPCVINSYHWYTDGHIDVRRVECPEGFYPGKSNVGSWYNNGIREILITLNGNIPDGYVKGRLKHERKVD